MKIVMYEGCIQADLTFNGVSESVLTSYEMEMILDRLLPELRARVLRGNISLRNVVQLFEPSDHAEGSVCEQCGDSPSSTTWEI
jgi:hypothetical protein